MRVIEYDVKLSESTARVEGIYPRRRWGADEYVLELKLGLSASELDQFLVTIRGMGIDVPSPHEAKGNQLVLPAIRETPKQMGDGIIDGELLDDAPQTGLR